MAFALTVKVNLAGNVFHTDRRNDVGAALEVELAIKADLGRQLLILEPTNAELPEFQSDRPARFEKIGNALQLGRQRIEQFRIVEQKPLAGEILKQEEPAALK